MFMITLPLVFYYCRILFYNRKNKVYVTEQGIGFEKRVWFKIQKKFFRFGEIGLKVFTFGLSNQSAEIFIIYPFAYKEPKRFNFLPKQYKKVVIQGYVYNGLEKEFFVFLRQKTKQALENISDEELKSKIKHYNEREL